MSYGPDQLDRWATWLETETSYAFSKFKGRTAQLRDFSGGVYRGDTSFGARAVSYLQRAIVRTTEGRPVPGTELRVVQELGKASLACIGCASVGRLALVGGNSLIAAFFDIADEWRTTLEAEDITPLALGVHAVAAQRKAFWLLQMIQDKGDGVDFEAHIRGMSLPLQATFINAAEQYAWPQPGLSSTADVVLWAHNNG
jgi:hypothetical protein